MHVKQVLKGSLQWEDRGSDIRLLSLNKNLQEAAGKSEKERLVIGLVTGEYYCYYYAFFFNLALSFHDSKRFLFGINMGDSFK